MKLLKNFSFLSIFQGINYLLPFLAYPYLIRILGIHNFGQVMFGQAMAAFFIIFIDYGFIISATREIAFYSKKKVALSKKFSEFLSCQLFLLLIFFFAIISYTILFKSLNIFYSFFITMGYVLFPLWLFQGLQKMNIIVYINSIIKILCFLSLFFIIKVEEQFIYVNFILGIGGVLSGILSLYVIKKREFAVFNFIRLSKIFFLLKKYFYVFLSQISLNFFLRFSTILLNYLLGSYSVGIFSTADKIISIFRQFFSIIFQSIFPYFVENKNRWKPINNIYLFFVILNIIIFLVCVFLFVYSRQIIEIFCGDGNDTITSILKIMSFIPFFISLNMYFYISLLSYHYEQIISKFFFYISVVFSLILIPMILYWKEYGVAWVVVTLEISVTLSLIVLYFYKFRNFTQNEK